MKLQYPKTILLLPLLLLTHLAVADYRFSDDEKKYCGKLNNTFQCAQAIERVRIGKGNDKVTRLKIAKPPQTPGELEIKLESGVIVLKDKGEQLLHSFQYFFADGSLFLIHIQHYEGESYLLIDGVKGTRYELDAPPVFNAKRNQFLTSSIDLEAGYNPNRVQFWVKKEEGWKRETSWDLEEWGCSDPRWIDENKIECRKQMPFSQHQEKVEVRRINGEWKF